MKTPLGIFSSDWHLDKENIEIKLNIVEQLLMAAQQLNLKSIYCLGDIFEERKAQPLINLNGFDKILNLFEKYNKNLIAIPGNHDKVSYLSEDSYLDQYRYHPNFVLIKDSNSFIIDNNFILHLVPYFDEKEGLYLKYLKKSLDKIKYYNEGNDIKKGNKIPEYKHILLTHISISGVKNNDRNVVDNEIKQSLFKDFNLVLVGHYHDRSNIGFNIKYIGSLNQSNFGEDYNKGYTILYDDLSLEDKILNFKKYIKININLKENTSTQIENLFNQYKNSEDKIRFEFIGTKEELSSLNDNKFKLSGIDIKKKQLEIEENIIEASKGQFISFTKNDILNEFTEFCKLKEIKDFKYGEKKLKEKLKI